MRVFDRAALVEIELVTAAFRRIWARQMLLAMPDLTGTPCVPAAIEETIVLAAEVQEEALVVEVVGVGDERASISL